STRRRPAERRIMSDTLQASRGPIGLQLVSGGDRPEAATWHGWTLASPLPEWDEAESPLPTEPQGEYSETAPEAFPAVPMLRSVQPPSTAELLAPAGGPDAGHAAFHFGADAIYLGLK